MAIESDPLYQQLLERLTERLAPYPRYGTLNALMYTTFIALCLMASSAATPVPDLSLFLSPLLYSFVLGWPVIVAIYSGELYFDSGAWRPQRERWIDQELERRLNADDYEVDEAFEARLEAMHAPLSAEISRRAGPYRRLALHAVFIITACALILTLGLSGFLYETSSGDDVYFTAAGHLVMTLVVAGMPLISLLLLPLPLILRRGLHNIQSRRKNELQEDRSTARRLSTLSNTLGEQVEIGHDGDLRLAEDEDPERLGQYAWLTGADRSAVGEET